MSGRRIIIVLCLALALSIATVPVNGEEASGTVTLQWLEYHAIEMNSEALMKIEASWDIRVTDGAPVNVYLMLLGQYLAYVDPLNDEVEYMDSSSELNTMSFSGSGRLMDGEPAYLVIECAGHSAIDSSTVEYEVEWDEAAESWYEWCKAYRPQRRCRKDARRRDGGAPSGCDPSSGHGIIGRAQPGTRAP